MRHNQIDDGGSSPHYETVQTIGGRIERSRSRAPAWRPERRKLPASVGHAMPVRYMGTKRALAPLVREVITDLNITGRVADLFSGMGSVASALAPDFPVLANDTLTFTSAFGRARFLNQDRDSIDIVRRELLPAFLGARKVLREQFADRLELERGLDESASTDAFRQYIQDAPHVGNSEELERRARSAKALRRRADYCLTTIYFSAGYFSTRQAIDLDALRYAIDRSVSTASRDWVLSAWLSTAALLVNAPGHSAQFLKPTSDEVAARVRRQWRRSVWENFLDRLETLQQVGDREWRAGNLVTTEDALELAKSDLLTDVSVVYIDPPYTGDQYSRFYHLHETLYRYDFPASTGIGRYRDGRFHTTFSMVRTVESAFDALTSALAARDMPLVVSYPANGLLTEAGVNLRTLLKRHYTVSRQIEVNATHSTLGASSGTQQKAAKEKLYVCVP
jgi:adenine-specific DNA-methyltransferase